MSSPVDGEEPPDQGAPDEKAFPTDGEQCHGAVTDDRGEAVICGGCRWVKKPRRWVLQRLRKAAGEGLVPLLREVDSLRRQRHWCGREGCWVHLLDDACSFWEPADPTIDDKNDALR